MELFQVSDGCIPNSKDSKTEVLFTWEQMWCYNHREQQSRSLVGPIQTLTLQKVPSLTDINRFTSLWCYSESCVFVFPSGSWLEVKLPSLYSWGVRVSPRCHPGPSRITFSLCSSIVCCSLQRFSLSLSIFSCSWARFSLKLLSCASIFCSSSFCFSLSSSCSLLAVSFLAHSALLQEF